MCGRYTTGTEVENIRFKEIIDEANRSLKGENTVAQRESGDIYPGDIAPVMVTVSSENLYKGMRWGFDVNGKLVINARSETALDKPMFRQSALTMRCLVPVFGYYEWNNRKEKFLFTDPNGDIILLAGLYRYSSTGIGEFTIITRDAVGEGSKIHDRMPLIIRDRDMWLHDSARTRDILASAGNVRLDIICQSSQQLSMF